MKPTEENIDNILLATSSTTPAVNIHDDPPECLNEGEGKVVDTIQAALDQAVQNELLTDHFIGRCVRKGKEATPIVGTEEYITSLCQRVEEIKDDRRKDVASRYVSVKIGA